MAFGIFVELPDGRAFQLSVEPEIELVGKRSMVRQWMLLLEQQHTSQHGVVEIGRWRFAALIEYGIKPLPPPLCRRCGIHSHAAWRNGVQTVAVVNHHFAGAPIQRGGRLQLELARAVVTTVADHAAVIDDWFDVPHIGDLPGGQSAEILFWRQFARLGRTASDTELGPGIGGLKKGAPHQDDRHESKQYPADHRQHRVA